MAGLLNDPAQITEDYRIAPEALLGPWGAEDEQKFLQTVQTHPWYNQFVQDYGEAPDLNSPDYNYRAAYKFGVLPELYPYDNRYHWSSVTPQGQSLKATNHPTAWMEDYMQVTGRDPHEPGELNQDQIEAIQKALQYRYSR